MRGWPLVFTVTAVALAVRPVAAQDAATPRPSSQDDTSPAPPRGRDLNVETHEHPSLLDRPHTVAELEGGILVLPSAPISATNRGGATPLGTVGNGDATVETGVHMLYRAGREWGVGAGALFAPRPTSDPNFGGAVRITHSLSYLFLGGEARYFPYRSRWFEGWLGLTAGALIIADRFATNEGDAAPPILGKK